MSADYFVLDTNILISAVLKADGPPGRLYDMLCRERAVLLFSEETWVELHTRLMNRKFDRYVSVALRRRFLAQLEAVSEPVPISGAVMGCRDTDDDKFLETALLGDAACLVTGDRDLLVLHPFQNIPILNPADCLKHYFRTVL